MARYISFNGVTLFHPGGVSRVNIEALAQVGDGALGIVGIIGEADDGQPGVAITIDDPSLAKTIFGSGPLADAVRQVFEPSADPRVPGGCSRAICVKTNVSTQATRTLLGQAAKTTNGENQAVITSIGYGLKQNEISWAFGIDDIVSDRYKVTVKQGAFEERISDLGGRPLLNLSFKGPDEEIVSYSGVAEALSTDTVINDSNVTAAVTADMFVRIVASTEPLIVGEYRRVASTILNTSVTASEPFSAVIPVGTTFEVVKLRLLTVPITAVTNTGPNATVTLNHNIADGAAVLLGAADQDRFNGLMLRVISGNGAGQIRPIKTSALSTGKIVVTLADNDLFETAPAVGDLVAVIDVLSADMTITGASGAATSLATSIDWGLSVDALGAQADLAITLSATKSIESLVAEINATLADATQLTAGSNYLARVGIGRDGSVVGSSQRFDFDSTNVGVDLRADFDLDPADRARGKDDLALIIDAVNNFSAKISASRSTTGATPAKVGAGVPEFFTEASPIYLSGAARGTSTNTNWQDAFDELLKKRVNTVVPLISEDLSTEGYGSTATLASVLQQCLSHVQTASGAGRSERNAIVGVKKTGATALTGILNAAGSVASPLMSVTFQSDMLLDVDGNLKEFPPWGHALLAAGMFSGVPVGEPITFKYLKTAGVNNNSTAVDPLDETTANSLLKGGVLFSEFIEGKGHRWVKDLTTWTADDNPANISMSVRQILSFISYEWREQVVEKFTGRKGTRPSAVGIKSFTETLFAGWRNDELIVDSNDPDTGALRRAYTPPVVSLSGNVVTLKIGAFPAQGIDFFKFDLAAQLAVITV